MEEQSFSNPVTTPSQDSKNIALLMWIGTIFFGFIPALIIYLIKTEDSYLADQSKEALNWAITVVIGVAIAWILCFILIGLLILPLIGVINVVFCILGQWVHPVANSSGFLLPCV